MERDFAIRFSDEVYASKDEVRKSLSISSIDSIWDRIQSYRNLFRHSLDILSIEHKNFSLCLTTSLQKRIVTIEKNLTKKMVFLIKMDEVQASSLKYKALMKIASSYAKENSMNISEETLSELVLGTTSDIPQLYFSLKNYLSTIQFYLNRSVNIYDINILTSFYGKILRKEIRPEDFESYVRMIDHNNPADHIRFGNHYNAAPLDKIQSLLNDVLMFSKNSNLFTLIKSIIVYFYLIYIKPFDYFNEECAILSMKYILANDDMEVIPFLLNLENRLLNINKDEFNQKF